MVPDVWRLIASHLPDQGVMLRQANRELHERLKPLPDLTHKICTLAAGEGWINILEWAYKRGYPLTQAAHEAAAMHGHLATLQWLHKALPVNITGKTFLLAAKYGHLAILEWGKTCKMPLSKSLTAFAASGGQIETLKWLRSLSCPWDGSTTAAAAAGGHLALLKWAVLNGCPLHPTTSYEAVKGGHRQILEWIYPANNPVEPLFLKEALTYKLAPSIREWIKLREGKMDIQA